VSRRETKWTAGRALQRRFEQGGSQKENKIEYFV